MANSKLSICLIGNQKSLQAFLIHLQVFLRSFLKKKKNKYSSFKVLIFLPNYVLQAVQCNQIYNICYRCKQLNHFTTVTLFLVVRIPLPDLIKLVPTTGLFLFSKEAILVEWRVRRIGQHYFTCCI